MSYFKSNNDDNNDFYGNFNSSNETSEPLNNEIDNKEDDLSLFYNQVVNDSSNNNKDNKGLQEKINFLNRKLNLTSSTTKSGSSFLFKYKEISLRKK